MPPIVANINFTYNLTGTLTITGSCADPQRGFTNTSVSIIPQPTTSSTTTSTTRTTSSSTTTSTIASTTTTLIECPNVCCVGQAQYTEKTCPEDQDCVNNKCRAKIDYTIVIIVVLVIIVFISIPYVIYTYFIKKKSKETFNQLYRKYRR
jgi:hypothetical protein